jgi:hypothetical protein
MDSFAATFQLPQEPRFRERNKRIYRLAHWPIWIFVFFIVPGPLVFDLFTRGFDLRMAVWLAAVLLATGYSGWLGNLPGTERKPYILRFTEDKPNPLYRQICYTVAWSDLLSFAAMNLAGLVDASVSGRWHMRQIYDFGYVVVALALWICGGLGWLPRTRSSTRGESRERRYFYATVWAVVAAQTALAVLWKLLPRTHHTDIVKLAVFAFALFGVAGLAFVGRLPRTQPVHYPEWAISD